MSKKNKVRAAGYVRQSVTRGDDGTSISEQRKAIEDYCRKQGWDYDPALDCFEDKNRSGSKKTVTREAYNELMSRLDDYDKIVVWKLDRFTRRLAELAPALETLKDTQTALITTEGELDTSTTQGRIFAELLGTFAGAEARNISDNVKRTQVGLAAVGRWKGGGLPYGWRPAPREGGGVRLVAVPEERKALRFAIDFVIAGNSIGATARELNARNLTAGRENPWSPQALSNMLRRQLLLGYHEVNGEVTRGPDGRPLVAHEPIITLEKWNHLQDALRQRSVVRPVRGGALLSGIAHCALCGSLMAGSDPTGHRGANYRCRAKYTLNKPCPGTSIKSKPFEDLIVEIILQRLEKPGDVERAQMQLIERRRTSTRELEDRLAYLRAEKEKHIDRWTRGVYKYVGGDEDWERQFEVITTELTAVDEQLADQATLPAERILKPWATAFDVRGRWATRTRTEQRAVARALLERVDVHPPNPEWHGRHLDPARVQLTWRVAPKKPRARPAQKQK